MSKQQSLDEILDTIRIDIKFQVNQLPKFEMNTEEAKSAIKALFLELIGELESERKDIKIYSGFTKDYDIGKAPNKSAAIRNRVRAKLIKEIEQL